jgi:Helix-loop-helix DNA-binding domain
MTFTKPVECCTPPGPPHHIPLHRRSSSASDDSPSSIEDYHTAMTTPTTSQHKLSPIIHSESSSPIIVADFAHSTAAISVHHETIYTNSSEYHVPSRRSHSFDGKRCSPNAYAPHPPAYGHHDYNPHERYHPYPRPRSESAPTPYQPSHAHHPPYYPPSVVGPHPTVVYRGGYPTRNFSTPPTIQDRREAHIRSEQKRRESINGGFADLHTRLTSEQLSRALALSCYHASDIDAESKVVFDTNSILGGDRKNSKAVLLQKAVKAIDWLSQYAIELHAENVSLHGRGKGKKSKHVKRGSKDSVVVLDSDVDSDAETKKEEECS